MEASDIKYTYQVSVGMPVWGVEKYIRRCLMSILDQEFDEMEVLVVNDCTPDKSIDIAKEVAARHPKGDIIRIIEQPTRFVKAAIVFQLYSFPAADEKKLLIPLLPSCIIRTAEFVHPPPKGAFPWHIIALNIFPKPCAARHPSRCSFPMTKGKQKRKSLCPPCSCSTATRAKRRTGCLTVCRKNTTSPS